MRAFVSGLVLLTAASPSVAQTEPSRAKTSIDKPVRFDKRWLEPFFTGGGLRAAAEQFRLEEWQRAADGLAAGLRKLPRSSPDRSPARFLLAMSRMQLRQWQAAGELFEELHEDYPLLAPYHAYHAARCRLRRGDTAGAIAWAEKVPARAVLEAEAVLIKIDALASEKRWADVDGEAGRFLERFPAGPRRAEAMFRRAEALEQLGRTAAAAALYRKIWADAPTEAWAARASERLEAIAAAAPAAEAAALRTRTAAEWVSRGMDLFVKNQNTASEAAFAAALAAPGVDPDLLCKARYHRAQSVWKQRQRPRAAPLFAEAEAACKAASDADLVVKALYQGARCLANMGDRGSALAKYAELERAYPQHSYADDARLRSAELAQDANDPETAAALLAEIPTRYPQADNLGEALWRLAFAAWRAGAWDKVHVHLDENIRRIPREEVWFAEGRAQYWKARAFEKQGKPEQAKTSYVEAIRQYPLSVYALLALERLRESFPQERARLLKELRHHAPDPDTAAWRFEPRPVFGDAGFLRAVELARLGLGNDARRELARAGLAVPESREAARRLTPEALAEREDILWITAVLLDRGRLWQASHAIPRYALTDYRWQYPGERGAAAWRLAYPRAFPEIVAKHSKVNGVPPALQLAIMREESEFNPRIESWANAIGLTQMLVPTAQRFATSRVTREALFDAGKNLELGSRFLKSLLDRYGGAAPLAIAGYNAGEGAVDRWLRESSALELDEFLEWIPYDQTRGYTKRVLASFFAYSWLYFPEQAVPRLSFSLKAASAPKREAVGKRAPRRR